MSESSAPHLSVLRVGKQYESLDQFEVCGHRDGEVLARVSLANAGIVRRDLRKIADKAAALREIPMSRMLEICTAAGQHFLHSDLPMGVDGDGQEVMQSPEDYVVTLSKTSGLPHSLCRKNMHKVFTVFDQMDEILRGLTRGMDPAVIDENFGEHSGVPVCYLPTTDSLGVVLPSNSPGVNSIWMPAVALKIPVVLKPGRDEPWTPWRIIQAFLAAGCPSEAFGFYPTDHEGAAAILQGCGRALLFGDESTTSMYANNPAINLHGPGRSKVLLGDDLVDSWRDHLEVLVSSVLDNGGRSCINASAIFVPRHADAIAEALGERLAQVEPMAPDAKDASLSAFANPKFAEFIDQSIEYLDDADVWFLTLEWTYTYDGDELDTYELVYEEADPVYDDAYGSDETYAVDSWDAGNRPTAARWYDDRGDVIQNGEWSYDEDGNIRVEKKKLRLSRDRQPGLSAQERTLMRRQHRLWVQARSARAKNLIRQQKCKTCTFHSEACCDRMVETIKNTDEGNIRVEENKLRLSRENQDLIQPGKVPCRTRKMRRMIISDTSVRAKLLCRQQKGH